MKRIAILGSCTTRDSVPWWPEEWSLVGYGARHPLASMLWPSEVKAEDRRRAGLMTAWRGQQHLHDIESSTLDILMESKPDVVILDVTDDRLGILRRADGGRSAGGVGPVGSDDTLRAALKVIVASAPRVVLNAAEWAGQSPFNVYLERVATLADREGIDVVRTRGTTENRSHQWGPGPFHLIDNDYARMVRNLKEAL